MSGSYVPRAQAVRGSGATFAGRASKRATCCRSAAEAARKPAFWWSATR